MGGGGGGGGFRGTGGATSAALVVGIATRVGSGAEGPPPLDWSATEDGPDVSIHLNAAQNIAGTLMAIDGHKNLDSLPEGAVCTLMIMIERELSAAERILENGHLRGGAS